MALQQHPDYHLGFFDAQCGVPIWEGECTVEYAAGWWAFWSVSAEIWGVEAIEPRGFH